MAKVMIGMRVVLGLIYVVFGLNFFFHFLPMPDLPGPAGQFMGALMATGYMFPWIKVTEILCGAFLLLNIYVPLALLVLAPITLNILVFHAMLAPAGIPMAAALTILNAGLGVLNLKSYKSLLEK